MKSIKFLLLTLLCIFTVSCTFITEDTGSINLVLPDAEAFYENNSTVIARGNTELNYNIEIDPIDGNNNNFYLNTTKLIKEKETISINTIPAGRYVIRVRTETPLYKYSVEEKFSIFASQTTTLKLVLKKEEKQPQNDNSLLVNFNNIVNDNPSLTVSVYKENGELQKTVSNVTSNVCRIDNLPFGKYKLAVKGESAYKQYEYNLLNSSIFEIKKGEATQISVKLIITDKTTFGNISGQILNGPAVESGIKLKVIAQDAKNNLFEQGVVENNSSYTINKLPIGEYTVIVRGGNEQIYYEGQIKLNVLEGNNQNKDIKLGSEIKIGSIEGKVLLPSNHNNINLTVTATNKVDGKTTHNTKVDNQTGKFTFKYISVGTYTLSVSGESDGATYKGSYNSDVIVNDKQITDISSSPITLIPSLKKGAITLTSSLSILDNATFTIDLRKKGSITSLPGYPVTKQKLPYKTSQLDSGEYDVSIKGKGSKNNYSSDPEWVTINVTPGDTNKSQEINISNTAIVGNLSGNISATSIMKGIVLKVFAQSSDLASKEIEGTVTTNSQFSFNSLPIGNYTITIRGGNSQIQYSGSLENVQVNEGDNTTEPITVTSNNLLGNIKGTVSLAKEVSDLQLTAYAYKVGTKSSYTNSALVDNATKTFTITSLPEGNYTLKIEGTTSVASYVGVYDSPLQVIKDQETAVPQTIEVKETLNKGTVTITSSEVITDNAKFNIDIRKNGTTSSLSGYPKNNQVLPYRLENFEPGSYDLFVEGKGELNNYSLTPPQWKTIIINSNDNKEEKITLTKTLITGNISGNIIGNVQPGVQLQVTANGNGITKSAEVVSSKYEIRDLLIGQYTLKVSGENDQVYYEGELLNVSVHEGDNRQNDIKLTQCSQFGAITGKVTLPEITTELKLTVKALDVATSRQVGELTDISLIDGTFNIQNLPKGSYKLSITGSSSRATYSGEYNTPITVERNQESKINGDITLNETLKNGSLTLNSSLVLSENANFTIDVRKGNSETSILGYPKESQKLPHKLSNFEAGEYKVSISGSDNSGSYTTKNTWQTVTVNLGKDETINIQLVKIPFELQVSAAGKDDTGDGSSNNPYKTVAKALSVIPNIDKQYTINIDGDITEAITLDRGLKIKLVGLNAGATITGSIVVNNTLADIQIDNVNLTNSASSPIMINNGSFTILNNATIERLNGKEAIELSNEGKLQFSGSFMFGEQNIIKINNTSKNPQIVINTLDTISPIGPIEITNIDKYASSPLVKINNGLDIKTAISNITLANASYEITTDGCIVKKGSSITPDPQNNIFVVNSSSGDDNGNNHNGTKEFKTVANAIKFATNNLSKKTIKIYLTSDTTEPASSESGSGYGISNNVTITTLNNANYVINGSVPFALQGSGAVLTLDKGIKINNTSNDKEALRIGYQSTVNLITESNIGQENYINVQSDGKINFSKNYTGVNCGIKVKMKGQQGTEEVGGAEGKTLITSDSQGLTVAEAVKKVTLISKRYIINSDGKIALKPATPIVGEEIKDFSTLKTKASVSGTYTITQGFTFDSTVTIPAKATVTLLVYDDIAFSRTSGITVPLIKVEETGSLTIKRASTTGSVTFDGKNITGVDSLIVSNGNIILENCNLINNKETAIRLEGDVTSTIKDTYIEKNVSTGNGGGMIIAFFNGGYPVVTLSGNTIIRTNEAALQHWGGGIYVNQGNLTLLDNAEISSDNTAGNKTGSVLAYQDVTNAKLNGKKITNNTKNYNTAITKAN